MAETIEPPEGFTLRVVPRPASAATRPASMWLRELRGLMAAGAGERWITPREAGGVFGGGEANSLAARGALLIAEKRSAKRYRLTEYGVRVASGR